MSCVFLSAKILFVLMLSVSVLLLICWRKKHAISFKISCPWRSVVCSPPDENRGKGWVLFLCVVLVYALVALVSYFSWPSGDEWLLMELGLESFVERMHAAATQHFNLNGRLPELIGMMSGLARSGWQDWLITPAIVAAAPFAVWYFAKSFVGGRHSISPDFYLLIASCFLFISPLYYTSYWVNVTYTWTSVPCVLLAALMFGPQKEVHSAWKLAGAYILGMYCGWGNETQSQMLMMLSPLMLFWFYVRKRKITLFQIACLLGVFSGCYMLFSSGSFAARAALSTTPLANASAATISDFVFNLNWEKVYALSGSSAAANLVDVPVYWRVLFVPYGLVMYSDVAAVPLMLLAALLIWAACKRQWKHMAVAAFLLLVSLEMAVAYTAGSLPNFSSYIPPSVVVICACAYLYCSVPVPRVCKYVLSGLLFGYALFVYVPDIGEAATYKTCDWAVDEAVAAQSAAGRKQIILPKSPLPERSVPDAPFYGTPAYRSFRGYGAHQGPLWSMLYLYNLNDNPKDWDNAKCADYFKKHYPIESVVRESSSHP